MKNTQPRFVRTRVLYPGLLAAFASLSAIHPANAALQISLSGVLSGQNHFDADILSNDLLQTALAIGGATQNPAPSGGTIAGIYDGSAAALANDDFISFQTNPSYTLTLALNLNPASGGSATGYDISKIQSIAGWGSADFGAQKYTLSVKTVAGGDTWTQIGTGAIENSAGVATGSYSSETVLTDSTGIIASGVTALQFVFTRPATCAATVIREIDVVGTPTVVPEPAAWALIAGGLGSMAFARRIRRGSRR